MNILEALDDPRLFGPQFPGESWQPWRAFLATLFGLPVPPDQAELVRACTGREDLLGGAFNEAWLVCGRRSGKSRNMALLATYLATFRDWRRYLAPGEVGTVMVLASDRRQARTIMRYVAGMLDGVPLLAPLVVSRAVESIELANRVVIEVHTASFRAVRGYTIVTAVLDEVAFWSTEGSAEPDEEILEAIRPAMATVPGALLIGASSPYAKRGVLWDTFRQHHGRAGSDVLVWQAPTRKMNPGIPESFIARALERDPAAARAEYLAQFREDVKGYLGRDVLARLIEDGVTARPAVSGITYRAFVDPSGGAADSMTLAIAHKAGDGAVLDALREVRPPFSPDEVVAELAKLLRAYRVSKVRGDRYGGEWPRERFRQHGIGYELSDKPKSDLYRDLLPLLTSGKADLLDDPRLLAQLAALERRKGRSGRDIIDHGPNGHDDLANAAAGALLACRSPGAMMYVSMAGLSLEPPSTRPFHPWVGRLR